MNVNYQPVQNNIRKALGYKINRYPVNKIAEQVYKLEESYQKPLTTFVRSTRDYPVECFVESWLKASKNLKLNPVQWDEILKNASVFARRGFISVYLYFDWISKATKSLPYETVSGATDEAIRATKGISGSGIAAMSVLNKWIKKASE